MANLKLIAIAIAVGVVAFLGLCVAVAEPEDTTNPSDNPPSPPGLRYDTWYEEIATSYDVANDPVQPDEGMKFILMHFRFVNDNVEAGISLDPKYSVWKIVSNGVEYMQHWTTYTHPERTTASTLYKGGQIDDIRVFQIPESDDIDSVRFKIDIYGYGDPFKIQKDETLL